jgi:hypothetical protein
MHARLESVKAIVKLWVDLFDRHNLLTYASAIALRSFVAAVACVLFGLGLLGALHEQRLWLQTIGPQLAPRVLPGVFTGIAATVHRVFASSNGGLLVLAAALAVWEVSGIVRAGTGALNEIYETEESRPWWVRFPLSVGLAVVFLCSMLAALAVIWAGHVSGSGWSLPVLILRWPLAAALVAFAFDVIVRWGPGGAPAAALGDSQFGARRRGLGRPDPDLRLVRPLGRQLPHRGRQPRGLHLPRHVLLHRGDRAAGGYGAGRARPVRHGAPAEPAETDAARRRRHPGRGR